MEGSGKFQEEVHKVCRRGNSGSKETCCLSEKREWSGSELEIKPVILMHYIDACTLSSIKKEHQLSVN